MGGVLSSLLFRVFRVSTSQASLALIERSVVDAPDHRAGLWRERDLSRTARRLSVWIRNNKDGEAELDGGEICAEEKESEVEERGRDPGPSGRG